MFILSLVVFGLFLEFLGVRCRSVEVEALRWTIFTFLLPSVISGPSCGWSCYAFIDLKNSSEQRGALDQCEVWHAPRVDLFK